MLYLAACRPSSAVRLYAADRRSKGGLHLEGEGKTGILPGLTLYGEGAVVVLDDPLAESKSEAVSDRFGGESGLEYLAADLFRHPGTIVPDLRDDLISVQASFGGHLAVTHRVCRVGVEVQKDLLNLTGIDLERGDFAIQVQHELDAAKSALALDKIDQFLDE